MMWEQGMQNQMMWQEQNQDTSCQQNMHNMNQNQENWNLSQIGVEWKQNEEQIQKSNQEQDQTMQVVVSLEPEQGTVQDELFFEEHEKQNEVKPDQLYWQQNEELDHMEQENLSWQAIDEQGQSQEEQLGLGQNPEVATLQEVVQVQEFDQVPEQGVAQEKENVIEDSTLLELQLMLNDNPQMANQLYQTLDQVTGYFPQTLFRHPQIVFKF